jgi:flagellar protein FliS
MTLGRPVGNQRAVANRYMEERVATASPAELIGMLFDAALANVKLGSAALEADDRQEASRRYMKAQDVVMELRSSLNQDAGELASQLDGIYAWVFQHLVTASVAQDKRHALAAAKEALRCLEPIVAAWAEATRSTR